MDSDTTAKRIAKALLLIVERTRLRCMKSTALGIAIICTALALPTSQPSAAILSDVFDLQCVLSGPRGKSDYVLHLEVPKYFGSPRIKWVGTNTHDLRVVVFDETRIIADVDKALSGFPDKADAMSFRINRISGAVEVNYLRNPTETDPKPPKPSYQLVMDEFSESGTCTKSERAF
jgi:hypothetical protein